MLQQWGEYDVLRCLLLSFSSSLSPLSSIILSSSHLSFLLSSSLSSPPLSSLLLFFDAHSSQLTDLLTWIDEIRGMTSSSSSSNQYGNAQQMSNDAMSINGEVEKKIDREVENEVGKGPYNINGKGEDHPSVPYSLSQPDGGSVPKGAQSHSQSQSHSIVVSYQIPTDL